MRGGRGAEEGEERGCGVDRGQAGEQGGGRKWDGGREGRRGRVDLDLKNDDVVSGVD